MPKNSNEKQIRETHLSSSQKILSALSATVASGALHPLDVFLKRWITSNSSALNVIQNPGFLNKILFNDVSEATFIAKAKSAYKGVIFASGNRLVQWAYISFSKPIIAKRIESDFPINHAEAKEFVTGGILGAVQTGLFLPFDTLKIQRMANPSVGNMASSAQFCSYLSKEFRFLWKGWPIVLSKNVLGNGIFFGVDLSVKTSMGVNNSTASSAQVLASSAVGSVASIIATAPLEVVKVRTQSVSGKVSMMSVIKTTLLKEGISAFFRGTTARIIFRAPKTATAFWALHQGERLMAEKKEPTEEKKIEGPSSRR